jgi:succinate-semialdehyde dehydrogenase/glutarate-semialdehyde dehydrogenase
VTERTTVIAQPPPEIGAAPLSPRVDGPMLERLAARLTHGPGERELITIVSPATGAAIGVVPHATEEDLELAVQRARFVQRSWVTRSARERAAVLLRFHDLVLDRRAEGMDLLQLEGGKARRDALEEVHETANAARYYGRASPWHLRPRLRRGALPILTDAREYHRPHGVVGVIAPWNFPLILGITDALPALAAGCGVVVKLDSHTPYSGLWAAGLLDKAGLPPGLLALVTGSGARLGPPLIERVDYVMFTGSTRVGREVAARCAERLVECSLELGGKNAMLVLDDANVERAAEGARKGSFSHGGQMCVGMERIYVHEDVYEPFTERFVALAKRMRLGAGFDYGSEMGSLLSQQQLETVSAHVADAVAKGATVLAGGRARPDVGPFFYEPTVLAGVTPEMALYAEETFGPVVSLYRVRSDDEAVELANQSRYGLHFSVWTGDPSRGRAVARRLEAGSVNVNEAYGAAWSSIGARMGGVKDSGLGRRHGGHGIEKYTEPQTVAVQRVITTWGPGIADERWETLLTAGLRILRRLPGVR